MVLKIGDKAVDFTVLDQDGNPFRLSDFFGQRNVVLFFYPKDGSPGCTKEACAFRDRLGAFNQLNAEIIGISNDSVSSHKKFAQDNDLRFRLGFDENGVVKKLYGVTGPLGMPGRITFVINKAGTIIEVYDSQIWFSEHIKRAKAALVHLISSSI